MILSTYFNKEIEIGGKPLKKKGKMYKKDLKWIETRYRAKNLKKSCFERQKVEHAFISFRLKNGQLTKLSSLVCIHCNCLVLDTNTSILQYISESSIHWIY